MNVRCDWLGTEGVDVAAQAALVRRAVADGYNGIALSIIDPKAFDAVVEEAVKRGVPVVAFNVDDNATPNARLSGVCQRFVAAGGAWPLGWPPTFRTRARAGDASRSRNLGAR